MFEHIPKRLRYEIFLIARKSGIWVYHQSSTLWRANTKMTQYSLKLLPHNSNAKKVVFNETLLIRLRNSLLCKRKVLTQSTHLL